MAGDEEKKPKSKAKASNGEGKKPKPNAGGGKYCCEIPVYVCINEFAYILV